MRCRVRLSVKTCIIIFPVFLWARTNFLNSPADTATHYPQRSIQFFLVNGVSAAYQHSSSSRNARRFTLDLSGKYQRGEYNEVRSFVSSSDTSESKQNRGYQRQTYSATFSVQWLHTVSRRPKYAVYGGCGPQLSLFYDGNSSKYSENDYSPSHRNYNHVQYGIGLLGLIGIKTTLTPTISLFVENQLSIQFHRIDDNNVSRDFSRYPSNNNKYDSNVTGYDIYGKLYSSKIGISVRL